MLPIPAPSSSTRVAQPGPHRVRHPPVEALRAGQRIQDLRTAVQVDVAREVAAHNHPQRAHRVFGADLLALVVSAPVVTDRHFVNRRLPLGELNSEFRFDAKPVAVDWNAARQRETERLVARLHVGQVEVRRHVARSRQQVVRQRVPVVDHAPLAGDQKPRAVHHVGLVGEQRTQHLRILRRVVLQIGVLYDAELARRVCQRRADSRPLAGIHFVMKHTNSSGIPLREFVENLRRGIRGSVVYRH